MTQLAGRQTMDTPSTEGNCVYAATPLGGSPYQATTIRVGSQMLEGYTSLSPLTNAPSTKVNPINPLPCAPGVRKIVPVKNTTVFFENKLFAVMGDEAKLVVGSNRPLTGPYIHPRIVIGSKFKLLP